MGVTYKYYSNYFMEKHDNISEQFLHRKKFPFLLQKTVRIMDFGVSITGFVLFMQHGCDIYVMFIEILLEDYRTI